MSPDRPSWPPELAPVRRLPLDRFLAELGSIALRLERLQRERPEIEPLGDGAWWARLADARYALEWGARSIEACLARAPDCRLEEDLTTLDEALATRDLAEAALRAMSRQGRNWVTRREVLEALKSTEWVQS